MIEVPIKKIEYMSAAPPARQRGYYLTAIYQEIAHCGDTMSGEELDNMMRRHIKTLRKINAKYPYQERLTPLRSKGIAYLGGWLANHPGEWK